MIYPSPKRETITLDKLLLVFDMHQRAKTIWAMDKPPAPEEDYNQDVERTVEGCYYDQRPEDLSSEQRWIIDQYSESQIFRRFYDAFKKHPYSQEQLKELGYNDERRVTSELLANKALVAAYREYKTNFAGLVFNREMARLENAQLKEIEQRRLGIAS